MKKIIGLLLMGTLLMGAISTCALAEIEEPDVRRERAAAFLETLNRPTVEAEANGIGLQIQTVHRSGDDYVITWSSTNSRINTSTENASYVYSKMHFIDPENYENRYQAFTRTDDGWMHLDYDEGDITTPFFMRIRLDPPCQVMYVYFEGALQSEGAPDDLLTPPLFFTLLLGESPGLYEETPRMAEGLFDMTGGVAAGE